MALLSIYLFGCFQVTLGEKYLTEFVSDKARALLAYLAIEAGQPHRRATLAALLWPDRPAEASRVNLRQTLHRLRMSLGDHESDPPFLVVTSKDVQLNCKSDHWLDTAVFSQAVTGYWRHHPQGQALCECCLERLKCAVDLYHGDLLDGFTLHNCAQFEWWLLSKQEEYHRLAIEALDCLFLHCDQSRDYPLASQYAQRAIELEPWCEAAHRQKMHALALSGQRCAAIHQYEVCREILSNELGVEPSPATARLFEQIRAGTYSTAQPTYQVPILE